MKLLPVFFATLILIIPSALLAQNASIKNYDFLIKMTLFYEASGNKDYKINNESFNIFLQYIFQMEEIKQNSFTDFVFIKINPAYKVPDNISVINGPFLAGNCDEYLVAVSKNGKTIYRLKGFSDNDFLSFYNNLVYLKYKKIKSSKSMHKNYYVKGLDLECLYQSQISRKKNLNTSKCLAPCSNIIYIN